MHLFLTTDVPQKEHRSRKSISKEGAKLENYTKYRLKAWGELADLLEGRDNLFVIACNKCFKEFETTYEPDCEAFEKIVADQGKNLQ